MLLTVDVIASRLLANKKFRPKNKELRNCTKIDLTEVFVTASSVSEA